MNEMKIFKFESFEVRVANLDGTTWFIARDVSNTLGYSQLGHALRLVDSDDKLLITNKNPLAGFLNFPIPDRGMYVINESGVYSMVFNSERQDAKKFKKWVTSEVLPSIRKTGKYEVNPFSSPEDLMVGQAKLMLQVCESLAGLQKKVLGLESSQQAINQRLDEALPRDQYITIMGLCAKYHLRMTTEEKRLLGMEASSCCRKRGLMIDSVPDKRYGTVNVYPEFILCELLNLEVLQ